jgi:RNA polymerase sigma-70 factor (ECF subfamily)
LGLNLSELTRLNDGALVTRAQASEREAFSELVRRHQTAVYRVCYRILGSREDAEDATQEAFIRAYRKLETFQGRSGFKTWMLRLAINVSLNERGRRKELPRREMLPEPVPGPEEEMIEAEAAARLHKALQIVQPNHRAAVVLHDLEGLTYEEAAKSMGVPEGTVKSWAHRGRKRLKELLT